MKYRVSRNEAAAGLDGKNLSRRDKSMGLVEEEGGGIVLI
jgi:hypothetical protein